MSILEKLNFSEVSRKSENTTPHMLMRRRLLNSLDEQLHFKDLNHRSLSNMVRSKAGKF